MIPQRASRPCLEPTALRRPPLDRRPRERPPARRGSASTGRVAVPEPQPSGADDAVLFPRRRLLGPRRSRDLGERRGEQRDRGDRVSERTDDLDVRPSARPRLLGRIPASTGRRLPLSVRARRRRRRGREELPPPLLRSVGPCTPADRRHRRTARPDFPGRSATRTPARRSRTATCSRPSCTEASSRASEPRARWSGNTASPASGCPRIPQMLPDGSILAVDYGSPGGIVRFRPDGHVLWSYHADRRPGCWTIRASAHRCRTA